MAITSRLTRRVAFHARHRMTLPQWSAADAEARFGWTARSPGHGHLYRVAVTVGGTPDPETGALLDLVAFDALLQQQVIDPMEGQDLNAAVAEFARGDALPTCEALAAVIWRRLAPRLADGLRLERVVVAEDDTLEGECLGA
ncbi:MAG: 6-carboxytetrahydropterin synthase [Gemmatimonadales bacterium]